MSVVEAERSRIAQRGFADPRADRDVAARLSEGPVPVTRAAGPRRAGNLDGDSGFNAGMRLIVGELKIFVLIFRDRRRLAMNGEARQW